MIWRSARGGQANVSKHLQVLLQQGFVDRRKEGTTSWYRISDPAVFTMCELVCGGLEEELAASASRSAVARSRLPGVQPKIRAAKDPLEGTEPGQARLEEVESDEGGEAQPGRVDPGPSATDVITKIPAIRRITASLHILHLQN